ncbi:MAG: NADH-quinone oxidoreductase subunit A [Acidobacteriota bacterium]
MSQTLLPYLPVFLFFLFAVALATGMVVFSTLLGRPRPTDPPVDLSTYECGLPPADPHHGRFTVRFYLVAMLFILFDLEVAFLYPWAAAYRRLGWPGFWLMMVFMGFLAVGFIYAWRKGALDWNAPAISRAQSRRT